MNKDFEIAVTLNTDEANEKLEQLTAKAQGLADLFTSIAEQADRAVRFRDGRRGPSASGR